MLTNVIISVVDKFYQHWLDTDSEVKKASPEVNWAYITLGRQTGHTAAAVELCKGFNARILVESRAYSRYKETYPEVLPYLTKLPARIDGAQPCFDFTKDINCESNLVIVDEAHITNIRELYRMCSGTNGCCLVLLGCC